jgi:hypothetical protein
VPLKEPEYMEFSPGEPGEVLEIMGFLAVTGDGWINFQPAVAAEDMPPPPGELTQLFSARGPTVPLATWTPGQPRRDGSRGREEVGIQHGTGRKARDHLADRGGAVPAGWPVRQDSPRRGLVVEVPDGVSHRDVLDWLMPAAAMLSEVALTGPWRAAVFRP